MANYADATGHTPMLPRLGDRLLAVASCATRTQEELLAVAREYKRRGLPLSVIVIDFFHWTVQGDWQFDPVKWPDPAAMVRELDEMGVKVMVSIWPTVSIHSARTTRRCAERGCWCAASSGNPPTKPFRDTRPRRARWTCSVTTPPTPRRAASIWDRSCKDGYYNVWHHGVAGWTPTSRTSTPLHARQPALPPGQRRRP